MTIVHSTAFVGAVVVRSSPLLATKDELGHIESVFRGVKVISN